MRTTILDLYCGMGGLSLGFSLGIRDASILGIDIEDRATRTYNLNLGELGCRAITEDTLKWNPEGEWDVVMGGSPCQPYSIANTSDKRGESHPLYPTFPRFFDIILQTKPKVFILENVKGLLTNKFKPILDKQISRVREHYNVKWRVLDASRYGVPQRRERLFVLGVRKDLGVAPSFPLETHAPEPHTCVDGRRVEKWVTVMEAIGDLIVETLHDETILIPIIRAQEILSQKDKGHKPRIQQFDQPSYVLDSKSLTTSNKVIMIPMTEYQRKHPPLSLTEPSATIHSHLAKTARDGLLPIPEMVVIAGKTDVREYSDAPSPTIANIGAGGPCWGRPMVVSDLQNMRYRKLTIKEALRLQSFPDWWCFPEDLTKSWRYRLIGEAVPPILAYRLAIHVAKLLGWKTREPPRKEEWQIPYFHRSFHDYCD